MSDKGSSLNSATDLIRHKFLSQSLSRSNAGFTANPITGKVTDLLYVILVKVQLITFQFDEQMTGKST